MSRKISLAPGGSRAVTLPNGVVVTAERYVVVSSALLDEIFSLIAVGVLVDDGETNEAETRPPYSRPGSGGSGGSGSTGGGDSLVVTGSNVSLPSGAEEGALFGYRLTAAVQVNGVDFAPGTYIFERNSAFGAGWGVRTLATSTGLGDAPSDLTPPSAIAGFDVIGGVEQATLSWDASVDAESDVHYRYRLWLTSEGSSGVAWIDTDSTLVEVTGIEAGPYTAQVYAYSAGGATTTASMDVVVSAPSGWATVYEDTFTAADGTPIAGRSIGNQTWSDSQSLAIISGNKAVLNQSGGKQSETNLSFPTPAADGAQGVEIGFDLIGMNEADTTPPKALLLMTHWPAVQFTFSNSGGLGLRVQGYDQSASYTDLVPLIETSPSKTGRLVVRKTGNLFQFFDGQQNSIAEIDMNVGFSGYKDKPIEGPITFLLTGFSLSALDNVSVRVLS